MCLLRFVRSIFCIWAACCDCFGIGSHSASGKRRTDTFNLNTHSFVSRKYFSVSISFRLAFMVYYDSIHIHFIILLLLRSTLLAFAHCWSCFDRKKNHLSAVYAPSISPLCEWETCTTHAASTVWTSILHIRSFFSVLPCCSHSHDIWAAAFLSRLKLIRFYSYVPSFVFSSHSFRILRIIRMNPMMCTMYVLIFYFSVNK